MYSSTVHAMMHADMSTQSVNDTVYNIYKSNLTYAAINLRKFTENWRHKTYE